VRNEQTAYCRALAIRDFWANDVAPCAQHPVALRWNSSTEFFLKKTRQFCREDATKFDVLLNWNTWCFSCLVAFCALGERPRRPQNALQRVVTNLWPAHALDAWNAQLGDSYRRCHSKWGLAC
jgi:hypothetical protein